MKTIKTILEEFANLSQTDLTSEEFIVKAIRDYEEAVKVGKKDVYIDIDVGFNSAISEREKFEKRFWKGNLKK